MPRRLLRITPIPDLSAWCAVPCENIRGCLCKRAWLPADIECSLAADLGKSSPGRIRAPTQEVVPVRDAFLGEKVLGDPDPLCIRIRRFIASGKVVAKAHGTACEIEGSGDVPLHGRNQESTDVLHIHILNVVVSVTRSDVGSAALRAQEP